VTRIPSARITRRFEIAYRVQTGKTVSFCRLPKTGSRDDAIENITLLHVIKMKKPALIRPRRCVCMFHVRGFGTIVRAIFQRSGKKQKTKTTTRE